MIKFVAAGLWLCAVTIGAVFFSFDMSTDKETAEPAPPMLGGLDYLNTPVVSVPVLTKEGIVGYFLAKFVYTAEPKKLTKLSAPVDTLITDELYTYLFSNPNIDFSKATTLDLDGLRNGIREALNKRIGEEVIQDVMVEQIDFLSKGEIRDNAMARRSTDMKASAPAADAEGGHGGAEVNPAH
jgi:hypothetical protein